LSNHLAIILARSGTQRDAPPALARYNRRVTKFAVCFLLVFGELAVGGMFALAIPPFFKIERGFYKSTASVYLASALMATVGLGMLAWRATGNHPPSSTSLWIVCAIWVVFCVLFALYVVTLWTDNGALRARTFSLGLLAGLIAVTALVLMLKPASFGLVVSIAYVATTVTSAMVLGLVSGAMMFGHWYLIDLGMDVEYLRSFIRLVGIALIADMAAMGLALAVLALFGGHGATSAIVDLFENHLTLFAMRVVLGPVASIVLAWMCWQTLKIPQTMAATGLLYIALMSVIVGEMLGRFILFRTALPL
jgi:hypothetical protein